MMDGWMNEGDVSKEKPEEKVLGLTHKSFLFDN